MVLILGVGAARSTERAEADCIPANGLVASLMIGAGHDMSRTREPHPKVGNAAPQ
jgi:hypothetical protein